MKLRVLAASLLFLASGGVLAQSPGWPQWGGPTRNFKAPAGRLAASWPAAGPRQLWTRALGEGYSGITVDADVLFTMYRPRKGRTANEVVAALDAATGRTLWEHTYQAPFLERMDMEYGPGPHSTPLVQGDLVYAVGVTGKLFALDKKSGRVVWSHDLYQEFGGKVARRGYSCSPIACGDTVVLTVGGRSGQAAMAFDRRDGRVAWKNFDFTPSPSSPILIKVDGQEQLVFFHADGIAGVDPKGSTAYWNHPHKTDYGLNISTPVWGEGNLLFVSSAYSGGSRALELDEDGNLALATVSPEGLKVHGRAQVLDRNAWTAPTLVGTRLYIRDRASIKALDLG